MKWVTREKARVDRIACPWLISRFVDREPVFLFVPASEVMEVAEREQAIPYDVPDVELGHHGDHCSFDAFVELVLLEERIKRAVVTMMPQLHVGDVVGNRLLALGHLHHLAGRNEEEHWLTVYKPTNQPWARNAIDTRLFSGHPFHGLLLLDERCGRRSVARQILDHHLHCVLIPWSVLRRSLPACSGGSVSRSSSAPAGSPASAAG